MMLQLTGHWQPEYIVCPESAKFVGNRPSVTRRGRLTRTPADGVTGPAGGDSEGVWTGGGGLPLRSSLGGSHHNRRLSNTEHRDRKYYCYFFVGSITPHVGVGSAQC